MELIFATSNKNKLKEAQEILKPLSIDVISYTIELEEPRGTLEFIAMHKAIQAYQVVNKPLIIDDSGLFINALNGFPGSFSSIVMKQISNKGILKLLEGVSDRSAYFKSIIAYIDEHGIRLFPGIVKGTIAEEIRGESGFGYDPIFIPKGYDQTYAENKDLKSNTSHRYKSLLKLKSYLEGLYG